MCVKAWVLIIQPDIIIVTGIAHGGSLVYHASLLELSGNGKAIVIDFKMKEYNRKEIEAYSIFKLIELIEGSSVSD